MAMGVIIALGTMSGVLANNRYWPIVVMVGLKTALDVLGTTNDKLTPSKFVVDNIGTAIKGKLIGVGGKLATDGISNFFGDSVSDVDPNDGIETPEMMDWVIVQF